MKKIKEIYKHKASDIAIFLGSGSSINNITKAQWDVIKKYDTWTTNNWLYHPFVPKFYHVEVKPYNREIWKKRKSQKNNYQNVIFIINQKRRNILLDIIGPQKHIYGYTMRKINAVKKNIVPNYQSSIHPNTLTCNLNSSFTLILELLYRFKYKKIIFFGIDLYNSIYFWTNRPEYGKTHCQWNKDHEGRKPTQPHNTAHIKNFIIWFSRKKMKKINGELCVGHKDTALYPDLRFVDIIKL